MFLSFNINFSIHVTLVFILFTLEKGYMAAHTISKCFHEGDFTVTCNKSRMPSSSGASETVEYMRYARVINGLQYNDTLCSYLPNTSCARKQTLTYCIDKPSCQIKNNWFSLEPECPGNSYYTQFEYDCQPAFYMCEEENIIKNVFSGIIYSPSYPNSFRSERSQPCYLTINLPKNHHVEITLDYFDMLKTSKCIGDYVEIQQYIEVNNGYYNGDGKLDKKRSFEGNLNNTKHRSSTRLFNRKAFKSSSPKQRRSKFKWHTLGTMCGRIEKSYTIKANADIINFKFRPLPINHPYLSALTNYSNKDKLGFKIYFQAIPPKIHTYDNTNRERVSKIPSSQQNTTPISIFNEPIYTNSYGFPIMNENENTENSDSENTDGEKDESLNTNSENYINSESNKSSQSKKIIIIVVIIVCVCVLVLVAVIVAIIIVKRNKRPNEAKSSNSYSKTDASNSSSKKTPGQSQQIKSNQNESVSSPLKNPSSIKTAEATQAQSSVSTAIKPSTKIVLEPEPRKMLAERPVLLQDLSTSRLLMKFKQEHNQESSEPKADQSKQDEPKNEVNDDKKESSSDTKTKSTPPGKSTENNEKQTPEQASNKPIEEKANSRAGSNLNTPKLNNKPLISDVYDGTNGGVYGAEIVNASLNEKTPLTNSKNKNASKDGSPVSDSTPTSKKSIVKNRKSSKDPAADEAEKQCLISSKKPSVENLNPDTANEVKLEQEAPQLNDTNPVTTELDKNCLIKQASINEKIDNYKISNMDFQNSSAPINTYLSTTPRKPAFNPLHVILKDKNKYHTTEYI